MQMKNNKKAIKKHPKKFNENNPRIDDLDWEYQHAIVPLLSVWTNTMLGLTQFAPTLFAPMPTFFHLLIHNVK
jgi:hypothetical protein